jgi:hypothetical protein
MIEAGTFVVYQIGMPSVKAEVLGMVRDGEQYMLRVEYRQLNERDEMVTVRKEFQRDRKFIEGLFQDHSS